MCEYRGYLIMAFILVIGVLFRWLFLPRLALFNAWGAEENRGRLFIEGIMIIEIGAVLICSSVLLDHLFGLGCNQGSSFYKDYVFYLLWIFALVLPVSVMNFVFIRRGTLPKHIDEYGPVLKLMLFIEALVLFLVGILSVKFMFVPFPANL